MKIPWGTIVVATALAWTIPAWSQLSHEPSSCSDVITFQDISVVPMDTERVLPHQTVIMRNGNIAYVGLASSLQLPPKTIFIDGQGKYLTPAWLTCTRM
ncbi:MAG: hypothetical protein WBV31_02560 [Terriglobales bacterium]|jgi:hypothetical protein